MPQTVEVTMYRDVYTGKIYDDLERATKEELKSKNRLILRNFAEKLGYKTIKNYPSPENQLLRWIEENNHKAFVVFGGSGKDLKTFNYNLNLINKWYYNQNLEEEIKEAYKLISEKIDSISSR